MAVNVVVDDDDDEYGWIFLLLPVEAAGSVISMPLLSVASLLDASMASVENGTTVGWLNDNSRSEVRFGS